MAWFRSSSVEQAQAPASEAGPGIRSHRADDRRSAIPLHPCRGVSSASVDRSSVDPRASEWIPTRCGVKMSGGVSHFNYRRNTLPPFSANHYERFAATFTLAWRDGLSQFRPCLRTAVGSTEAAKDVIARFVVVGPTRATRLAVRRLGR